MINLDTFDAPVRAVVVGSSGAIGQSLFKHLLSTPEIDSVQGFSRSKCEIKHEKFENHAIDLTDEETIIKAKESLKPYHLIIIATGMLHQDHVQPEKRFQDLDPKTLETCYTVNTIGPMLVAKHFLEKMNHDNKSVFAFLSAKVGSIEENRLGGWYGYRSSKAALNMHMKSLSIEIQRFHPQSIIVSLHPGTVKSKLSDPFSHNLNPDQLFEPDFAAEKLLRVINSLETQHNGGFISHDGTTIPF